MRRETIAKLEGISNKQIKRLRKINEIKEIKNQFEEKITFLWISKKSSRLIKESGAS